MSVPSKSICREGWLVEPVCQRQSAYAVHKSEMSEKKKWGVLPLVVCCRGKLMDWLLHVLVVFPRTRETLTAVLYEMNHINEDHNLLPLL